MADREHEAIRAAMNVMRTDIKTVAAVLTKMASLGYSAGEAQAAINEIARRAISD